MNTIVPATIQALKHHSKATPNPPHKNTTTVATFFKMDISAQDIQYYNIYEDNSPEFFAFSNALRTSIMDDMRGAMEGPKETKLTWKEVSEWTLEQVENHVIAREIMSEQKQLRKGKEFSFMNYFGVRLSSSGRENDNKKFRENDVDFMPYIPDSIENGVRMQRWRLVVENGLLVILVILRGGYL